MPPSFCPSHSTLHPTPDPALLLGIASQAFGGKTPGPQLCSTVTWELSANTDSHFWGRLFLKSSPGDSDPQLASPGTHRPFLPRGWIKLGPGEAPERILPQGAAQPLLPSRSVPAPAGEAGAASFAVAQGPTRLRERSQAVPSAPRVVPGCRWPARSAGERSRDPRLPPPPYSRDLAQYPLVTQYSPSPSAAVRPVASSDRTQ